MDIHTDTKTHTWTYTQIKRHTHGHTHRYKDTHMDIHTDTYNIYNSYLFSFYHSEISEIVHQFLQHRTSFFQYYMITITMKYILFQLDYTKHFYCKLNTTRHGIQ